MTEQPNTEADEKPPFFNSWPKFYGLLMTIFAVFVLLFYLLTRYYA